MHSDGHTDYKVVSTLSSGSNASGGWSLPQPAGSAHTYLREIMVHSCYENKANSVWKLLPLCFTHKHTKHERVWVKHRLHLTVHNAILHMQPHTMENHVWLVIHEVAGLFKSPAGSMWPLLKSPFLSWTETQSRWFLQRHASPQQVAVLPFFNLILCAAAGKVRKQWCDDERNIILKLIFIK